MSVSSRGAAFEDGRAAFDRGDYAAAFAALQPLASEGEGDAQLFIGILYENGLGLPLKWYRRSADQGFADAQRMLGVLYENGYGVQKDPAEARRWFELARSRAQGSPVRDKPAERGVSPTIPALSGKAQAAAVDSKSK